jgi:hypothetical protein
LSFCFGATKISVRCTFVVLFWCYKDFGALHLCGFVLVLQRFRCAAPLSFCFGATKISARYTFVVLFWCYKDFGALHLQKSRRAA